MKNLKKILFSDWLIGIIITIGVLIAYLAMWAPMLAVEHRTYDFRARMLTEPPDAPVAIVAIDDASIEALQLRWPWPRKYVAGIIQLLSEYGARVIGVNVLYTEPNIDPGQGEIASVMESIESMGSFTKNKDLMEVYTRLQDAQQRLDNDAMLESSIAGSGKVVLPLFLQIGEKMDNIEVEHPAFAERNSIPAEAAGGEPVTAVNLVSPIPQFADIAMALGHVNMFSDPDGSIRKMPLFVEYGGRLYPSFALQLVLKYLNYNVSDVTSGSGLNFGKFSIPSDKSLSMYIRYKGGVKTFKYHSFMEVAQESIPPSEFKDKIVIVALVGSGLGALNVTPMEPNFPSVEILATMIDNVLAREFISRPDWAQYAEIAAIVIFGLVLSLLLSRLKALPSAMVAGALLLAWNGAAVYLFVSKGYWVMMSHPSLLLLVGYTVLVSKRFMVTEKRKEKVESDSIETNKMLGLSFQGQGMLDMALEKFMRVPLDSDEDTKIRDHLYNLALDFERKRQFNKAVSIYQHIKTAGNFRDIDEKIEKLTKVGETMIFGTGGGLGGGKKDGTMIVSGAEMTPTLGRYEILRELGKGAMGIVYLGRDPKINRQVAVKTVRFDEIDEKMIKEVKERFFREAEAAGRLSHPNIVTIFDAGEDMDLAYVAMELLDGMDLSDYVLKVKDKRMSPKMAVRIIGQVADALNYAHKQGIVHRDIKPANIMLLKNGTTKVTDFGIARVVETSKTQTGVVLGTPSYMSPEQVVGKKVDGRSDLFSMGVMFYELLAGKKPFTGDSIATLMYNIANQPHPPLAEAAPGMPECCAKICDKLLVKDLEKRYQNGAEVVRDLKACYKTLG